MISSAKASTGAGVFTEVVAGLEKCLRKSTLQRPGWSPGQATHLASAEQRLSSSREGVRGRPWGGEVRATAAWSDGPVKGDFCPRSRDRFYREWLPRGLRWSPPLVGERPRPRRGCRRTRGIRDMPGTDVLLRRRIPHLREYADADVQGRGLPSVGIRSRRSAALRSSSPAFQASPQGLEETANPHGRWEPAGGSPGAVRSPFAAPATRPEPFRRARGRRDHRWGLSPWGPEPPGES